MRQLDGVVVFNKPLIGDYWLLEVLAPEIAAALQPGQYINIRVRKEGFVPYLRRPFSVYRVSTDRTRFQIAYKVVGAGTEEMTRALVEGGTADIIGPLGRGFILPEGARRVAVVGRGIGIASLPTLVDACVSQGVEVFAFLSARDKPNLVGLDIFEETGCKIFTHTDEDITPPMVTDNLYPLVDHTVFDAFYVCGSRRLTKAVDELARKLRAPAQVAMEQHMACGFGDCHGCVIEVNLDQLGQEKGYREVCTHGPVFESWEVVDV